VNEIEVSSDIEMPVWNQSGMSTDLITASTEFRQIARALSGWVDNLRASAGKTSMFDRGAYTPSDNPYAEMRAARSAVRNDDIVSGVAETTEAFAFQGVKWESENPDDADVFNQLNRTLNLDAVVRTMWREEYTYSQVITATVWGWHEFTVRGRNPIREKKIDPATGMEEWVAASPYDQNGQRRKGVKRKKKYRVWAPTSIRVLDPMKVVPVGVGPMGQELLAWQASDWEIGYYAAIADGEKFDPVYEMFFLGKYEPQGSERTSLVQLGVDVDRLMLLNPQYVNRHTSTKADYERFADVRLKSVFGVLDMKRQLMAADRAALVGSANYILLVKKGSKEEPAQPEEIAHLKENYSFIAKVPIIISDHRLSIEIIAPKADLTLNREKYDVVDGRIMARLLGMLTMGSTKETNVSIARSVARAMENRRHMLRRYLETTISRAVVDDPRNAGIFEDAPSLVYTPRNIALDWEASLMQAILGLRTQRDISRETILEYVGLDQGTEAMRMEVEADIYDDVFKTRIPFSAAPQGDPTSPQTSGGQGGRPVGGGDSPMNATTAKPRSGSNVARGQQ